MSILFCQGFIGMKLCTINHCSSFVFVHHLHNNLHCSTSLCGIRWLWQTLFTDLSCRNNNGTLANHGVSFLLEMKPLQLTKTKIVGAYFLLEG